MTYRAPPRHTCGVAAWLPLRRSLVALSALVIVLFAGSARAESAPSERAPATDVAPVEAGASASAGASGSVGLDARPRSGAVPGGDAGMEAHASDAGAPVPVPPGALVEAGTDAAAVAPPVLVSFSQASYPSEALASGLSGEVVLVLDIDALGAVRSATVQTAAGHGFDEAAREAALRFRFRPAERDGKPVPSRILYRYAFTFAPAPPPTAQQVGASDENAPARVRGRIWIGDTDAPLAGAKIVLVPWTGQSIETVSNEAGEWSVAEVPPGSVAVHVEAPGFSPWDGQEYVRSAETLEIAYRMRMPAEGLEVTVRGERQDREITRRSLDRKELGLVPGAGGDALKSVMALPGIARSPVGGMAGMLIVRGSGPQGTQTFVDGTLVPSIYHFGIWSAFPTEMIESIDFYPGNFSAKYGRGSGGIVEVHARAMDADGKLHGLIQNQLGEARFMLRGPIPLVSGWKFALAARRSYLDLLLGPAAKDLGFSTFPVYADWQLFAETEPTSKSLFRIGFFGSDDRLKMVTKDANVVDPGLGNSISSSSTMLRLQAFYRNAISDRMFVSATADVGLDSQATKLGNMYVDTDYIPLAVRGELSYRLADWLTVRAGPDIIYYHAKGSLRMPAPGDAGLPEAGPFSAQPLLTLDTTLGMSQPAGYAELEWLPSERAKVLFGTRLDYFSETRKTDTSPRLNARYDLHHEFPRTTARVGAGLFYEPPRIDQVVDVFGSKGLSSNRSTHYSLGVEQEISREVEVSVEGFYKDLTDVVVRTATTDGSLAYTNTGDGRVIGLETLLRWKPVGRFFGWVAYTLSRSTRHDRPGAPERLFEYDQTHILNVLGSYDLGRGWRIGGRFRYVSGNPYTPCLGGVLDANVGVYSCRTGDLYSARVPPTHQLDLRVDKAWRFGRWQVTAYLDVQNVYNRANPDQPFYNYNYTQPKFPTGLPILPILGVRGEF